MGVWNVREMTRQMSAGQLTEWMAYYEMTDFISGEASKGSTAQNAFAKWRAIVDIQNELRAGRKSGD